MTSYASSERRESKITLPGDRVASIEEYVGASGLYEDKDGFLRSSVIGLVSIDSNSKTVAVTPLPRVRVVKQGFSVFGVVSSVRQDLAVIDIYGIASISGSTLAGLVELPGLLTGLLPISQMTVEYVKDPLDYYRPGDLVIAKTLNNNNPYALTTKPPQYGVLYAVCSRCLSLLKPAGTKTMVCEKCGNVESRKVSALASSTRVHSIGLRFLLGLKRW
ncbi:MAG: exosome complex RNA-binding protein Csl4 [Acidilobaceae archaeon]